ncbi:YraN family protein [Thiohalobacter sp. IOR34]|uniref:YraN family protein n=1 Tax=Thiohalobacter sp. IOR34 TaxID=3057176 RepID=UPI0025B00E2B|nr:YraN family protein [Thiohalobacter sp. IOR34]WJW74831.1 YraN family protein [Thiohalobacter sp. IOR34]
MIWNRGRNNRNRLRGRYAEDRALHYLQRHGLRLLARNFHCRGGEIDLIMQQGDSLIFVEVRYRSRSDYGSGLESVDRRKRERIRHCALHYLQRHPRLQERPMRFDVVAIAASDGPHEPARIDWIRNAFDAC